MRSVPRSLPTPTPFASVQKPIQPQRLTCNLSRQLLPWIHQHRPPPAPLLQILFLKILLQLAQFLQTLVLQTLLLQILLLQTLLLQTQRLQSVSPHLL